MPTAGDSDQVTPVLVVPVTDAVNWLDCPAESEIVEGDTVIPTVGTRAITALALLVVSATLVAVNVTVWLLVIDAGAVNVPPTTVPTAGVRDHCTPVFVAPETDAVNCCDWPPLRVTDCGAREMATAGGAGAGAVPGCRNAIVTALPPGTVAMMFTISNELTEEGAVYRPVGVIEPLVTGEMDHEAAMGPAASETVYC